MCLDAGNLEGPTICDNENGVQMEQVFSRWEHWRPASVSHHGTTCCELVREWILSTDLSFLNGGDRHSGPRWLRERFEWGPTRYPIFWCEIGRSPALDCGVHAALAHEVFLARGVSCLRVQMVQQYSEDAANQWHSQWYAADAFTSWLDGRMIYHEGCAILSGDSAIMLWDPSAGWWVDSPKTSGYGSVRAIRVTGIAGNTFEWGAYAVPCDEWVVIDPPGFTSVSSPPPRKAAAARPPRAQAQLRTS